MKFDEVKKVITASKGKYLALKDLSIVYDNIVYLGKFDSKDNYVEVDQAVKDEYLKKIEEELKQA